MKLHKNRNGIYQLRHSGVAVGFGSMPKDWHWLEWGRYVWFQRYDCRRRHRKFAEAWHFRVLWFYVGTITLKRKGFA